MTAKAAWGIRTTIANFDIPVGRGIVGRLTAGSKPTIQLLNERNVYNPAVVFAEAWKACIAVPVIAGGQMIGALSLYTRTRFGTDSLSKLRDNRRVELDCLQFVRRFRKRSMQAERERLIESRLERLQIGVELLGFAHDLAESAERAASRASELRSELPKQLLPPALESTLADLGEDAEVVHQVTRSMNRLVRSQRIERRDFDLHDEITVVEPILIAMTDAVELKIPRGLIVHGDPLDVQRIIINLVSNARYWTSEDNAEVVVTAVKSSIDSSIVDLSVRDNGRGMTEVERRAATDLLYSTRKNGLGLGLFVVKRLTDRLGGELSIASTLHRGTTVTVSLPISERRR
jgi:signal transduction histidine kinase